MIDSSGKNDPVAVLDLAAMLDLANAGQLLPLFLIFTLLFCN